ncbi:response regulator [Candidatus Methanoperedens nitratireducens]|uniref:Putative PAS/PAC sensor protein n=1 Tax=Candidatus Methanoperedens nitratireducens TaxID=1392998 RepID=A0A284VKU8_9EURY
MTEKQILIVEDEIIVAEDIRRSAQHMGYAVLSMASSGDEAIKKAQELNPDLVLMDIMLNGKMDGIRAAEQIRSRFNIPVIYLTAYSDEETLERAKITEPFGYVIKPFKERELHINIEIALYKHNMEKKLKESKQWLSAVINGIGDAVIATDTGGLVNVMNPIAEILTGWQQGEASGKPLAEVFNIISEEKGREVENPVSKVMREGSFYGLAERTVLVSKGGMKIPVDIIGSPIKDEKENVIGVVVIFYDILERQRTEEALKRSAIKAHVC